MVEPEIAFADLNEDMACAEAYLQHCLRHILEHCQEDLGLFDRFYEKGLIDKLEVFIRLVSCSCETIVPKTSEQ